MEGLRAGEGLRAEEGPEVYIRSTRASRGTGRGVRAAGRTYAWCGIADEAGHLDLHPQAGRLQYLMPPQPATSSQMSWLPAGHCQYGL